MILIPYNTDVSILCCNQINHFILNIVSILILIHHNILIPFLNSFENKSIIQQFSCIQKQIRKIHRIICLQNFIILLINLAKKPVRRNPHINFPFKLLNSYPLFLQFTNSICKFSWLNIIIIFNSHIFFYLCNNRFLIIHIINIKIPSISNSFRISFKQSYRKRVKCRNYKIIRLMSNKCRSPFLHLSCRLIRKSKCQNIKRRNPYFFYHVCDSISNCPCFTTSRSSQYQYRPFYLFRSFSLLFI